MQPVDIIVMALALGAAAGLQATTEQAIKDIYSSLKDLLRSKYGDLHLALLEEDPASEARRAVVREELAKSEAPRDVTLLEAANQLLYAISRHGSWVPQIVGISMVDVTAAIVTIEKLTASDGTGAELLRGEYGEIHVGEVSVGKGKEGRPKRKSQ